MTAYESIYKKIASLEQATPVHSSETADKPDAARYISPIIAHELNNVLTIVQGYADRLLLGHSDNSELQPHLKLVSEAARRAAVIVRAATPQNANATFRKYQNSQSLESVA